jgi:hypothetical protein
VRNSHRPPPLVFVGPAHVSVDCFASLCFLRLLRFAVDWFARSSLSIELSSIVVTSNFSVRLIFGKMNAAVSTLILSLAFSQFVTVYWNCTKSRYRNIHISIWIFCLQTYCMYWILYMNFFQNWTVINLITAETAFRFDNFQKRNFLDFKIVKFPCKIPL